MWYKENSKNPYKDENFQLIIDFFLFKCPSFEIKNNKDKKEYRRVSNMGISLREQGWKGTFLTTLLSSMKHTFSKQLVYDIIDCKDNFLDKFNNIISNINNNDSDYEVIIYVKNNNMSKTSSIFYYIRNALAHGSFSISNKKYRTYYFESKKNENVKARMRIREQTLLKWIDTFYKNPVEVRNENKKKKIKIESDKESGK